MSKSSQGDINALWAKQDASFSSQYTIKKGGTYYLSGDLTASGLLAVDAEGEDVVIQLQGHTFTCTEKAMGAAFRVLAAKSVTVVGDGGKIIYSGGALPCGVKIEAGDVSLENLAVSASTNDDHINLAKHDGAGVMVNGGTLTMRKCDVSVDMSNQAEALDDGSRSFKGGPSGIYIASGAGAAKIVNCKVKSVASPLAVRSSDADDTLGYAYGLQALTSKKVTVKGGSFSATCAQGDAFAIRGSNLALENNGKKGVGLTAKAGGRAVGIQSLQKKGVLVDCLLDVSYAKAFASDVEAALYSSMENGFVIGKNCKGKGLGMMTGSDDDANVEGAVAATVDSKASFSNKNLTAMFASARSDIASKLEKKGDKLVYALKSSNAAAKIGAKKYASFASALSKVKSGQTITLLKSIESLSITRALNAKTSFAVDLNGKSVESATVNTKAALTIEDSSNGKGKVAAQSKAALTVTSAGELVLAGVKLSSRSASTSVVTMSVADAAKVTLRESTVTARANKGSAVCIDVAGSDTKLRLESSRLNARGDGATASAYGIKTSMQGSVTSLCGSTIDIDTVRGTAGGFDGKGTLSIEALGSTRSKVLVHTSAVATSAFGVNMTSVSGQVSSALISDADVSVTSDADASTGEYWCLQGGSADPSYEVAWTFKGTCSLKSANDTHIAQYKQALLLDAGASFDGDVVVKSLGLKKCVVAQAADSSSDITAFAAKLLPYAQGAYADWHAEACNGNASLRWYLGDCVTNTRTSASYQTLADAIDEAGEGDTIALTADISTLQTLAIDKTVTIDLAGHCLTMKAGKGAAAGAAGSNAAIVDSASGDVTIKDSARSGSIDISTGCDAEVDTTLGTVYQGFAVTGGGRLSIDGCKVNLSYTGKGSSQVEMSLRGIGVVRGAVKLANGTSLNVVSAAAQDGAIAPVHATGIYASQATALADGAYSVEVDSSSSVSVSNTASTIERGSLHYPESSALGNIGISVAPLTRIYPSEDSDLYKQIVEKFRQSASLDSSAETSDASYDAQIYYAAPMQLDDGTYIWAFSAPVSANDLGKPESIVPSLIFEQSTYQVAAEATGVEGSSTFAGNVSLQGSINATSTGSGAYAVNAMGKGTWTLAGQASASGASGSYALKTRTLDLRDYFDLGNISSVVHYPSGSSNTQQVVEQVQAVNEQIASTSTAKVVDASGRELAPAAAQEAQAATPGDGRASKVTVTFTNLRDANGAKVDDVQAVVDYGGCLAQSDLPDQPDYTAEDGASYRFVGWALSDALTYDPQCMTQLAIDDNLKGAVKGAVSFTALYVRVEADECLVTFKNGNKLVAYAVEKGARPSYGAANAGDAAKIPAHDSVTGYTLKFKGWLTGWNASETYEEGDGSITTKLPVANGDVVYTARYACTPTTQSVYFYSWRKGVSSYSYSVNPVVEVKTGEDLTPYANKIAQIGDIVEAEDATYVMTGWSPRKTDTEPLYTTELPALQARLWGDKNIIYATYAQVSQTYNVRFMNGDAELASLSEVKASSSIDAAFRDTGVDKPAATTSGWEFDGWALAADGSALKGSMTTVAQAYVESGATDGTLVLHAVFVNSYTPEVNFKSESGSIIRSTTVKYGQSVADAGIEPTPARKAGYYFKGWTSYNGELFDVSTSIDNDIDLTASYGKLEVTKAAASKVKVSLGKAAITTKRLETASNVGFEIKSSKKSASAVRKRVAQDKNKVLASYTMSFGYEKDGSRVDIPNGFGTITMQLPVANGTMVKVYWLRSNGTAGVTATKAAKDGYVSFALADWGAGDGNLVVAKATGSTISGFKPIVRPGGASTKPAIAVKPTVKTKKAALKKDGKKTTSTKYVPADQEDADNGSVDNAAVDEQGETQDQESNPAVFYIVLAALVLLAAAFARRMYLFAAKRKEEDLDEELDDSADTGEESIRF